VSAEIFRRRWLGLLAMLAGLIFIVPYLLHAVVANSGCQGTSGACDALQDTLDYHARWLVLAIALAPLIVAVAARTLTTGMFAWAFPFAMIMLAGAMPLLTGLTDIHSADAISDLVALPAMIPLLFLLVLLVALSAGDDEEGGAASAWKAVLGFVALAAVFVTAQAWLTGLATLPYAGPFAPPLGAFFAHAHAALGITAQLPRLANSVLIGFILAGAGLMASARSGGGGYKSAYA
jgi:hypothetical protein